MANGRVRQSEPTGPRPPLPGLGRVAVTVSGVSVGHLSFTNVFHVMQATPSSPSTSALGAYATSFSTAYANAFKSLILNQYAIRSVQVGMLDGSGAKGAWTGSVNCTAAAPGLPPQCAVTISWYANTYWRGGKPRTYLGGIPTAALPTPYDSALDPAYAHSVAAAADSFLAAVNILPLGTPTATLGMVSYFHNYAFRSPPLFFPFNAAVVHERIDSQRRRSGKESGFGVTA